MFINNGIANKTMEYCAALKNNETNQYLLNSNSYPSYAFELKKKKQVAEQ